MTVCTRAPMLVSNQCAARSKCWSARPPPRKLCVCAHTTARGLASCAGGGGWCVNKGAVKGGKYRFVVRCARSGKGMHWWAPGGGGGGCREQARVW